MSRTGNLHRIIRDRETVHLAGHPDWDAGYVSALALVEAYLPSLQRVVDAARNALPSMDTNFHFPVDIERADALRAALRDAEAGGTGE